LADQHSRDNPILDLVVDGQNEKDIEEDEDAEDDEDDDHQVIRDELNEIVEGNCTIKELKAFMVKWSIPSGASGVMTNVGGSSRRTKSDWIDDLQSYVDRL